MKSFEEVKEVKRKVVSIYKNKYWYRGAGIGGDQDNFRIHIYVKEGYSRSDEFLEGVRIKFVTLENTTASSDGSYNKKLTLKNIWKDFISPVAIYTNIKYGIDHDMFGAYWWGRLVYTILIFIYGMMFYHILHKGFDIIP